MKGYLLAVLAAISWSSLGIWGSLAFDFGIDPLLLVTLRAIIASLVLLVVLTLLKGGLPRLEREGVLFFSCLGLFGVALNYLAYFYALKITSVSVAVVLLYTYPAIVTLAAGALFKERITFVKLVALVLTVLGIAFVVGLSGSAIISVGIFGVLFGLLAGITAATHSIMTKFALRKYSSLTTVTYSFVFGSVFLVLLLLGIEHTTLVQVPTFPIELWGIILALALIPTLLGYFLYVTALNYIEVSKASIVTSIEPVAAIVLAFFLLSETLTPTQLAGAVMVLAGVLVVRIKRRDKELVS